MPDEKIVETPKGQIKVKVDDKKVKFDESHPVVADYVAETVADPLCDESNPIIISFQDVCQAAFMIKGGVDVTPCKVCIQQSFREIFSSTVFLRDPTYRIFAAWTFI